MREEWRYILPVTGLTLVAGTWPSIETTLNLRSAELDPKPNVRYEHRQPFLPEGHEHDKSGPPPRTVVTVASSTAVNMAYSLPDGVTIEELPGYYRIRVPFGWPPPKA